MTNTFTGIYLHLQNIQNEPVVDADDDASDSDDDEQPLMSQTDPQTAVENAPLTIRSNDFYTLSEKIELGEMSQIFFPSIGSIFFYVSIATYLFGDLSIYSAAVSTTLRDVICDKDTTNGTSLNSNQSVLYEPCWVNRYPTRFDVYRICLTCFTVLMSPWVFLNVSKTKHLQFLTMTLRWLSFLIMISIATYKLIFPDIDNPNYIKPNPPRANFHEIPFLVGSCIYSFMSQHSLPSLLIPIKDKTKIGKIVSLDYFLIALLYSTLALTGIFAFNEVKDLYTLNFIPSDDQHSIFLKGIDYFLTLFPVFTLSTSFPIIAITLRNNLQTLFVDKNQISSQNYFVRKIAFPLMAIFPPFLITFNTENVQSLVSFTGCYAGACIQYLIPVALVYYSRRTCANILGRGIVNDFRSRFQSNGWLIMILCWTFVSLVIVSINYFR